MKKNLKTNNKINNNKETTIIQEPEKKLKANL